MAEGSVPRFTTLKKFNRESTKKFWNATKMCVSIIIGNFYFPQGSQSIRKKLTKKPSVADPVVVFHIAQGLPFQGASTL